jgi:hypothetical protein
MGAVETKQVQQEHKQDNEEVYVLELKGGYYYVGKSVNVDKRFMEHVAGEGKGSSWTSKHEPVRILERKEVKTAFDEDGKTLEVMEKYGIDRVRGGSYTAVDLSAATKKEIQKQLDTANNRCYKCHKSGHFATKCTAMIDQLNHQLETTGKCPIKTPTNRRIGHLPNETLNGACFRCGNFGHWANTCYATWHVNGSKLK